MRSWQIIVASAAAATIAVVSLLSRDPLMWHPVAATLVLAHWPAITVIWFGVYGVAALLLTSGATVGQVDQVAGDRAGDGWAPRYIARLAVTQYFTSVLVLLGLGLSRVPVEAAPLFFLPTTTGATAAFAACGALAVLGLLAWLCLVVAAALRRRTALRQVAKGREMELLRDILELLRTQETARPSTTLDVTSFADRVERRQRVTLTAVRGLTAAINRLRSDLLQNLEEMKTSLPEQGAGLSPTAIEDLEKQLRVAVAAADASAAKLGEMALLLSGVAERVPPTPAGVRSRLSIELQGLLREMTPPANRGEPLR